MDMKRSIGGEDPAIQTFIYFRFVFKKGVTVPLFDYLWK